MGIRFFGTPCIYMYIFFLGGGGGAVLFGVFFHVSVLSCICWRSRSVHILDQIEKSLNVQAYFFVTELNNSWGKYTVISVAYYSKFSNSKLWNPPDCEVLNWTFAPPEVSTKSFLLCFLKKAFVTFMSQPSGNQQLQDTSHEFTWINTPRHVHYVL